jgi:hypothetical protein
VPVCDAAAPREIFDAEAFLRALSPEHLSFESVGSPAGINRASFARIEIGQMHSSPAKVNDFEVGKQHRLECSVNKPKFGQMPPIHDR